MRTFITRSKTYGSPDHRRRGKLRIELSSKPVKNTTGQRLAEIWWRGKQWAVTKRGVECLDGSYSFGAERLLEYPNHPWPMHMAEKDWVDIEEFTTAWLVAIILHGKGSEISVDDLRELIAELPPIGESYLVSS